VRAVSKRIPRTNHIQRKLPLRTYEKRDVEIEAVELVCEEADLIWLRIGEVAAVNPRGHPDGRSRGQEAGMKR
jgi:hypothetical protein